MIKVEFIVNSSIYIETDSCRILLDGIHGRNPHFTLPRKEMRKAVFGMNSRFKDVDYLIFTHRHTDHFDAASTDEYVRNNNVKGVYCLLASDDPSSYLEDRRELFECRQRGILREIRFADADSLSFELEPNIRLIYCRTAHLDSSFYKLPNAAICLQIDNKQLLFMGDTDHNDAVKHLVMSLGIIDGMFVTPLFLAHSVGRNIINTVKPKEVVIYHLPDEADDTTKLRLLCDKNLKYEYACPVRVFDNEGVTIEF